MKDVAPRSGRSPGDETLHRAQDAAIAELEARLRAQRARSAASLVRRFVAAEEALAEDPLASAGPDVEQPSRSPEGWSGSVQGARHRAEALAPSSGLVSDAGPSRPARRGRAALLLTVEALALLGFLLILGVYYVQLQDLNHQVRRQAQGSPPAAPALALAIEETAAPPPATAPPTTAATVPVTASATAAATLTPRAEGADALSARASTMAPVEPTAWQTTVLQPTASQTPAPSATPTLEPTRRGGAWLLIPTIGVDAPIVEGDDTAALARGVGHRSDSAAPGADGNSVLSAHNDIHGAWFEHLHKLEPGDLAEVQTDDGVYVYTVRTVSIVAPTAVEVLDATDEPVLTLISCYPYLLDTHRVVVVADLVSTRAAP